jgi:hypothetical protein
MTAEIHANLLIVVHGINNLVFPLSQPYPCLKERAWAENGFESSSDLGTSSCAGFQHGCALARGANWFPRSSLTSAKLEVRVVD